VIRHLERFDFSRYANVYVVGAGKAGVSMAAAAERVIGRRITAGFVNVKESGGAKLRRIELHESGHPVPDRRGLEGARRIAELVESAGRRDLVVRLIFRRRVRAHAAAATIRHFGGKTGSHPAAACLRG